MQTIKYEKNKDKWNGGLVPLPVKMCFRDRQ